MSKYLWNHVPWILQLIVLVCICTVPLSFSFCVLHQITKANLFHTKTNQVIHLINKCVSFQYVSKYDWQIWPKFGEQPLSLLFFWDPNFNTPQSLIYVCLEEDPKKAMWRRTEARNGTLQQDGVTLGAIPCEGNRFSNWDVDINCF